MEAILDLQPGFGVLYVPIVVRVRDGARAMSEAQSLRRGRLEPVFQTRYRLVDEVVYRIYNIVYEGLLR